MWKKNKGSAMMVSIVASLVVMMFCLSLLLISYSLFFSVSSEGSQYQCKELAKSFTRELERELLCSFEGPEEESNARNEAPLWYYLRSNIFQDDWPYYNPQEEQHTMEQALRSLSLASDGVGAGIAEGITVTMYWESSAQAMRERQNKPAAGDGEVPLYVTVTCERGEHSYQITSLYYLKIGVWENVVDIEGTPLDESERWEWYLAERR